MHAPAAWIAKLRLTKGLRRPERRARASTPGSKVSIYRGLGGVVGRTALRPRPAPFLPAGLARRSSESLCARCSTLCSDIRFAQPLISPLLPHIGCSRARSRYSGGCRQLGNAQEA